MSALRVTRIQTENKNQLLLITQRNTFVQFLYSTRSEAAVIIGVAETPGG